MGNRPGLGHGGGAGPVRASAGPAREHRRAGTWRPAGRASSSLRGGAAPCGAGGSAGT